jgi:putative tryptophan/tyrosine transport system substrate-binding protein
LSLSWRGAATSRLGEEFQPDAVNRFAAELAALDVDVIYAAYGSLSALAAKRATKAIPIVFYGSADPVGMGLVASLAHPGGNVTGSATSIFDTFPKSIEFLVEAIGKNNIQIVEIYPPGARSLLPWFAKMDAAISAVTHRLGVKFEYAEAASITEIEPLLKRLVHQGVAAAILGNFPLSGSQRRGVAALFIENHLASIGDPREGFLLHYLPDNRFLVRKAAEYVDKILQGARPADLPVEQVSTFELAINLRVARGLGLKVPQSLLLRAGEVIE